MCIRDRVKLRVTQGGQPVPGAEIAFAAVDEGLLALRDSCLLYTSRCV